MAIIPLKNLGAAGVNLDVSPVLLPPNGFSKAKNIRFDNGSVSKIKGHQAVFSGNLSVQAQDIIFWNNPTTKYYIYGNGANVYRRLPAGTDSSILSGASSSGVWQFSAYNGGYTILANNTKDTPRYIQYGTSGAAQETSLTAFPGWISGEAAAVVRPFKNAIIAGNITKTANSVVTSYPGTIKISSLAAPGSMPASWTVGVGTTTADEFELSQTSPIVDIVEYRGTAFVFTGDSIHTVNLASGNSPTRVNNINYGKGLMSVNCAAVFDGGIFCVDKNDIYVAAGTGGVQGVADMKVKDYFYEHLHATHYDSTYVVKNEAQDEIWVCFPNLSSSGACNEALIWNFKQNTWTTRDLPNTLCGTKGHIVKNSAFDFSKEYLVMPTPTKLQAFDIGSTFDGTAFGFELEKTSMDLASMNLSKWNSKIYLFAEGSGSFNVNLTTTSIPGKAPIFKTSSDVSFTIGKDSMVSTRENGTYIHLRLSGQPSEFKLSAISLDAEPTGGRQ